MAFFTNNPTNYFKKIFLLFIPFTVIMNAQSTVYVNYNTGSDAGSGTAASPYKTFTKAYAMAANGDILDLTGTFTWTNADETADAAITGFTLGKNITIQGQGANQTIIQAATSALTAGMRIFTVNSGINITFKNLEMRYGSLVYPDDGGAIAALDGSVTLWNCYIHDNRARQGGAISGMSTLLNISNSTLSNNSSSNDQPGICAGAIDTQGAGSLILTNSTIFGNIGPAYGGGLSIRNNSPTNSITNCTIANNSCTDGGGGIDFETGTLLVKNTIIANNICSGFPPSADFDHYDGVLIDNGFNIVENYLFEAGSGNFIGTGTITGDQANLNLSAVLAVNNSLTGVPTASLTTGSVAINAGSATANGAVAIPTIDQRGLNRVGSTDIGAYEFGAAATQASTVTMNSNASGTSLTVGWTIGNGTSRAVFMKEQSGAITNPVQGAVYSASTDWSSKGTQLGGSGYYCIYNGTGNTVTVTGTLANTSYVVQVFDYTGSGSGTIYNTATATANPGTLTSLPVELTSFTASSNGTSVQLKWQTATEVNNYGFDIERQTAGSWTKIGFVAGNGTTNAPMSYSYVDATVSGTATYRLKQIDRDGKFEYSREVEASAIAVPAVFALSQNYPNPFNPVTVIGYSIASASNVSLKVFDVLGREVAELVNAHREPGSYTAVFDASPFASGLYFYKLDAGSFSDIKRMSIVK
ncbi:MAG TPA: choice-of-anchor Q domain-containing protein [Bacteroidota bacterium]|nr:choice-of-anchor Q domain-containing protein [Bacteroidota bacterium]